MAHAKASIGTIDYAVSITAGRHALTADEPTEDGGRDTGPTPLELLCAALCGCTSITLRMYAKRKGWPLRALHVDVDLVQNERETAITRLVTLEGDLDSQQRARLADIVERTPVTLTLKRGARITTSFPVEPAGEPQ
jgi:putative redox protein